MHVLHCSTAGEAVWGNQMEDARYLAWHDYLGYITVELSNQVNVSSQAIWCLDLMVGVDLSNQESEELKFL